MMFIKIVILENTSDRFYRLAKRKLFESNKNNKFVIIKSERKNLLVLAVQCVQSSIR